MDASWNRRILQLFSCLICGMVVRGQNKTSVQISPSPTISSGSPISSSSMISSSGNNYTYNGTLGLNYTWNDELWDNSSVEYRKISGEIEERLTRVFQNESGFVAVKVNKLSNGSIIARFVLEMKMRLTITKEKLELNLKTAFNDSIFVLLFFEIRTVISIRIGPQKTPSSSSSSQVSSSIQPLPSGKSPLPSVQRTSTSPLLTTSQTIETTTTFNAQPSPSIPPSQESSITHPTPSLTWTSSQATTSLPGIEATPLTLQLSGVPTTHAPTSSSTASSSPRMITSLTESLVLATTSSSSVSNLSTFAKVPGTPGTTSVVNTPLPGASPRQLPTSSFQSSTQMISTASSLLLSKETSSGLQALTSVPYSATPLPGNLITSSHSALVSRPSSPDTTISLQKSMTSPSLSASPEKSLQSASSMSLASSHMSLPISAIYSNVSSEGPPSSHLVQSKTISTVLVTATIYPPTRNEKVFSCRLILGITWNVNLNNSNSPEYKELAGFVEGNLTKVFRKDPGFLSMTVDRFFPGSVGVDLTVVMNWTSNSTPASLEQSIQEANSSGNIALPISSFSVQLKEISSTAYSSYVVHSTSAPSSPSTSPISLTETSSVMHSSSPQLTTPLPGTLTSPQPPITTQSEMSLETSSGSSMPITQSLMATQTPLSTIPASTPSTTPSTHQTLSPSPSLNVRSTELLLNHSTPVPPSTYLVSGTPSSLPLSGTLSTSQVLSPSPSFTVEDTGSILSSTNVPPSTYSVSGTLSSPLPSGTLSTSQALLPSPSLTVQSTGSILSSAVPTIIITSLFNITLKLPRKWTSELSNTSSLEYSYLAGNITKKLSNVLIKNVTGFKSVVVNRFFEGSVGVDIKVEASTSVTTVTVINVIKEANSTGILAFIITEIKETKYGISTVSTSVSTLTTVTPQPSSPRPTSPLPSLSVTYSLLSSSTSASVSSSASESSSSVSSLAVSSIPSMSTSVVSLVLPPPVSSSLVSSPPVSSSVVSSSPPVSSSVASSPPVSSSMASSSIVSSSTNLSPSLSSSVTTSSIMTTPTPVPTETQKYKCKLRLDRIWNSNLLHSYSQEYKALAREIEEKITRVLSKLDGFISVLILRFFEGSVGVDMDVVSRVDSSGVTEASIEESVKSANASGTLGLKLAEISVEKEEPKPTGNGDGLETWVIVVIVASVVVFVMLIIIIVLAVCVRRLSKKKSRYNLWIDDSVVYSRRHTYINQGNGEMVELSNYPRYQEGKNQQEADDLQDERGSLRASYENAGQNSEELI